MSGPFEEVISAVSVARAVDLQSFMEQPCIKETEDELNYSL